MGSQQLLLVVLGMVVVGVALAVAITMFQANAIELNRTALANDLLYLGGRARDYYWRPTSLGGGNRSFAGVYDLRVLSQMSMNENGRYYVTDHFKDKLVIVGRGKIEVGMETTQVEIRINEQTNTIRVVY
jgi:hypothetical protein